MTASIPILPYDVVAGADIDITWSTIVSASEGGINARYSQRPEAIRVFHLGIMPEDFEAIRTIYRAVAGPRWPIGVRDWSDYELADEELSAASFDTSFAYVPIYKTSTAGDRSTSQRILLPDQSEVALTVKVDDVDIGTAWQLVDFGILAIDTGLVDTASVVKVSGRFLVPACFAEDTLTVTMQTADRPVLKSVVIREILEEELIALTTE